MLPLLLAALACGELAVLPTEPEPDIDPSATFTRVQTEVFTPTCTVIGCHDTVGQQEGLVLTPDRSFAMIVDVPSRQVPALARVEPGDPAASYLYRKVTGSSIVGERMPFASPPLTDAQMQLVRNWILRGAPND
ncbi:MAG: hypothetical protein LC732_08270 [Acidobacteria bacterium]|nr:hypothetical protein [Acidobacteriota bacterium]